MSWTPVLLAIFTVGVVTNSGLGETVKVESVLLSPIQEAQVAARETGLIVAVHHRRGQSVRQNEVLARIDDSESQLACERAAIELEVARRRWSSDVEIRHARKTLEVSQAELSRASAAVSRYPKSVSDGEMDRLHLTVERDQLAIERTEMTETCWRRDSS